jgi:hypothetical protein
MCQTLVLPLKGTPRYLGCSDDGRTGRWQLRCLSCGKHYEPITTLFATQITTHDQCGAQHFADYNKGTYELFEFT